MIKNSNRILGSKKCKEIVHRSFMVKAIFYFVFFFVSGLFDQSFDPRQTLDVLWICTHETCSPPTDGEHEPYTHLWFLSSFPFHFYDGILESLSADSQISCQGSVSLSLYNSALRIGRRNVNCHFCGWSWKASDPSQPTELTRLCSRVSVSFPITHAPRTCQGSGVPVAFPKLFFE